MNENKRFITRTALINFPNFILNEEMKYGTGKYMEELRKIAVYYYNYKNGVVYYPEGTKGDYVPSNIKFKLTKTLIDKESRFMFSQCPDINVMSDGDTVENDDMIGIYKKIVSKIIENTKFPSKLLSASKDCFIGGRVGCCIDFSETNGIGIKFYNAMEFYYETDYENEELTKFVTFKDVTKAKHFGSKTFLVNKYVKENGKVYMSSVLRDLSGKDIETLLPYAEIALDYIPAIVITNVGLTDESEGVSDCEDIESYESGINRIGNADIDTERKGMNPVVVLVDMNHETTQNLSSSAGSVWDMESNQVLNEAHPEVKMLAPELRHVEAVKETIARLRSSAFSQLDIPDISIEGMLSSVTSYKAVRALYFPLTVRCDEKLKVWKPALSFVFKTAIELCILNPELTKEIYEVEKIDVVGYTVDVVENYALLADETEEKEQDLEEINLDVRSRLSYLMKWRNEEFKTSEKAEEEIERIAMEKNMLDTLSMDRETENNIEDKDLETDVEKDIEDLSADEELENMLDKEEE